MRIDERPASAMSARTRLTPTSSVARSVAMLSLCAIIPSSTERAVVVPARLPNTGLLTVRTLSSIASCSSSDSRPASTSRRY